MLPKTLCSSKVEKRTRALVKQAGNKNCSKSLVLAEDHLAGGKKYTKISRSHLIKLRSLLTVQMKA